MKALSVANEPADAQCVREALAGAEGRELQSIDRLNASPERLKPTGADVDLLDLAPPAPRASTLRWLSQVAAQTPIVVLSPRDHGVYGRDAI